MPLVVTMNWVILKLIIRTIVATNNEMNEKCKLVAEMLNLKEEFVWNNNKSFKTLLHLSCDIEGIFFKFFFYIILLKINFL